MIKFIPYPLITGFTTGIALTIFTSQIKDFFGLKIPHLPVEFIPKWGAILLAFPTIDWTTFFVAAGTLLLIILIRQRIPKLPWGITSVLAATLATIILGLPIETIASRFGVIQRTLPALSFPDLSLVFSNLRDYIPDALTVAFLAGIESLLSAMVADSMSGTQHKANCELMGQGIANIGSVLFGGIPATGAIARTATNIKSGARTPLAGMIHSLTLLVIVLAFAPFVSMIPLAALSAVLMMVAWNMSELEHFRHLFKAPKSDIAILLTTFFLTVFVDLTVAVAMGMLLAAFLFIKKMGDISLISPVEALTEEAQEKELSLLRSVPEGIEIFEIDGPFFFGMANSLKQVLSNLEPPPKVILLRLGKLQHIDASGMHSLEEFYHLCKREGTVLILSEIGSRFYEKLKKFGIIDLVGEEHIHPTLEAAFQSLHQ